MSTSISAFSPGAWIHQQKHKPTEQWAQCSLYTCNTYLCLHLRINFINNQWNCLWVKVAVLFFAIHKLHQILYARVGEIAVCNAIFCFKISCSIPEIFTIKSQTSLKSCLNFDLFSVTKVFWGWAPKFLTKFYEHGFTIKQVAKFGDNWLSYLGDLALKKN